MPDSHCQRVLFLFFITFSPTSLQLQAHTIVIVGEMCLPFLLATTRLSLLRHDSPHFTSYGVVCRSLMFRARTRGCRIVLPEDLMTGATRYTAGRC